MTEIEHRYTKDIVCPYCGYVHGDCWEWSDNGETECYDCEKTFAYERYVEVTYITSKIDETKIKMSDIEKQIEEVFNSNKEDVDKCVFELEKVFVKDYGERLCNFLNEITQVEVFNMKLVKNVVDLYVLVDGIRTRYDDPILKDLKIKVLYDCFKNLKVEFKDLEMYKKIIFWTLSWLREDIFIETWVVEVPLHLQKQLKDHGFLKEI